MTQYINKADAVAEIENRIKETESMRPKFDQFWAGQISAFKGVLKILNTLEVKEVDLEKEIDDFMAKEWDGIEEDKQFYDMMKNDLSNIAKHFFNLGLKAQKKD